MTTINDGSEGSLGDLHDLVARTLAKRILSEDATAADLNAALKFLSDNNITASSRNKSLRKLVDATGNVTKFPFGIDDDTTTSDRSAEG